MSSSRAKVHFHLKQDSDGYPPAATESVWAHPTGNADEYVVANIPFFTVEATLGDVVATATDADGNRWFDRLVHQAEASLIRVVFFNQQIVDDVIRQMRHLGCAVEYFDRYNILSASVPPGQSLPAVRGYLAALFASGDVDYEEAILRPG